MFLEVSRYLVCRVLEGASILDSKGIPSWLCSHYKRNQNGRRLFRALFFHERGTNHLPPHHAPYNKTLSKGLSSKGVQKCISCVCMSSYNSRCIDPLVQSEGLFFTQKICEQLSPVAHSFWKNATLLNESILTCFSVHPRKLLEIPFLLMVICHSLIAKVQICSKSGAG